MLAHMKLRLRRQLSSERSEGQSVDSSRLSVSEDTEDTDIEIIPRLLIDETADTDSLATVTSSLSSSKCSICNLCPSNCPNSNLTVLTKRIRTIPQLESTSDPLALLDRRLNVSPSVLKQVDILFEDGLKSLRWTAKGKAAMKLPLRAACYYIAGRQVGTTEARTFREVATAANIPVKEVIAIWRKLNKLYAFKLDIVTPDSYTRRLCDQLSVPLELAERSARLADTCNSSGVTSGRQPIGVASAAIYLICAMSNYPLSLDILARHTQLSPLTIRSITSLMMDAGLSGASSNY